MTNENKQALKEFDEICKVFEVYDANNYHEAIETIRAALQPKPSVDGLVEALEKIAEYPSFAGDEVEIAKQALDNYHNQPSEDE